MGVYIDMEMPNKKNGAVLIIYPDGKCAFEDGKTYQAVPVPPHGRLIDAREMFLPFVVKGQRSKRYHLGEKWELNGAEIREVIDSLPTIIPADEGE
jgi:hypothetical protein